jgi:hypothetical protein
MTERIIPALGIKYSQGGKIMFPALEYQQWFPLDNYNIRIICSFTKAIF